jgi:hypothetical protein
MTISAGFYALGYLTRVVVFVLMARRLPDGHCADGRVRPMV